MARKIFSLFITIVGVIVLLYQNCACTNGLLSNEGGGGASLIGFDKAYEFQNASSSNVALTAFSLFTTNPPLTVELFIKRSVTGSIRYLFSLGNLGSNKFFAFLNAGGNVVVAAPDGGCGVTAGPSSIGTFNDMNKHHIAMVYSVGRTSVFVDGVESFTTPTAISCTLDSIKIGSQTSGISNFDGIIDEFRISNVVRYTTGMTPPTAPFVVDANTVLLLKMNDLSTVNYSAIGGSMTLSNITLVTSPFP